MDNLETLNQFFKEKGITQQDIAERLGVSKAYVNALLVGRKSFGKKQAELWSDLFGLSKSWLLTGEGDMLNESSDGADNEEYRPRLPMTVEAGKLSGFAESATLANCELVPVIKAFPDYEFTMMVRGDSMLPKYESGDEIAIKKVTSFIEWGKVYVLDTYEGPVLKRLYEAGEKLRCVSYNKEYPDFLVDKSEVIGVYRIVGLIRY